VTTPPSRGRRKKERTEEDVGDVAHVGGLEVEEVEEEEDELLEDELLLLLLLLLLRARDCRRTRFAVGRAHPSPHYRPRNFTAGLILLWPQQSAQGMHRPDIPRRTAIGKETQFVKPLSRLAYPTGCPDPPYIVHFDFSLSPFPLYCHTAGEKAPK